MKKTPLILLLMLFTHSGYCTAPKKTGDQNLTILTWNIRYNNPGDGANAWPNRKDKVFALLREAKPQIICLQEVLSGQMDDLTNALPQYSSFGAGRDDGNRQGEWVPVFFDKNRYQFLSGDHFWLSETPDVPGKLGWDAVCARMVTWVALADRTSHDTLFVFNTHFDHVGVKARLMSAQLLTRAADSLAGNHPAIIAGDFNSTVRDSLYTVIIESGFKDSRTVSATAPIGPEYTFTGFHVSSKPGDRIDFIFVRNTKPIQNYIVSDDNLNGFYPSDHLPVILRF